MTKLFEGVDILRAQEIAGIITEQQAPPTTPVQAPEQVDPRQAKLIAGLKELTNVIATHLNVLNVALHSPQIIKLMPLEMPQKQSLINFFNEVSMKVNQCNELLNMGIAPKQAIAKIDEIFADNPEILDNLSELTRDRIAIIGKFKQLLQYITANPNEKFGDKNTTYTFAELSKAILSGEGLVIKLQQFEKLIQKLSFNPKATKYAEPRPIKDASGKVDPFMAENILARLIAATKKT